MTSFQSSLKRTFDLVFAASGLAVLWPVILVTWALARRDTGATGFFLQERVGQNGKIFKVIKLGTMCAS